MNLTALIFGAAITIFVLLLIFFPEFRALFKGFTRIFIKDIATTPEGAEAIYSEKIDNAEDALKVFKRGARMAKGTTTEKGIVESYFANPFGPVQRQAQTEPLLIDYFNNMFNQNIKVGQIRTRLGVSGYEHSGPKEAAKALINYITNQK
jgi:hypothetical protein